MKLYRLQDAIAYVALHGFGDVLIRTTDNVDNRLVSIIQEWNERGRERIAFRLARGKWRGCVVATAYRNNPESMR